MNVNLAYDLIAKASVSAESENPSIYKYNGDSSETSLVSASSFITSLQSENRPPNNIQKLTIDFKRNLTNHYIRNITNFGARLASCALISLLVGALFFDVDTIKSNSVSNSKFTFKQGNLLLRTDTFILFISYLLLFSTMPGIFIGDKRFFGAESVVGLYAPCSHIVFVFAHITLASIVQAGICTPLCSLGNPSLEPWYRSSRYYRLR